MNPRYRGRGRAPGLAMALLAGQMAQVGFNNIPPVTLVGIIGQVVAHLRFLDIRWPSIQEVCISPLHVWYKQEWSRLFLAAFFHADEWHLYFNMASLLWKGLKLEPKVGSSYFLYLLAVFTALTNVLYVALGMAAEHWFHDPSYLTTCAVGFSGVLFALKVVTTHMSPPGVQLIMGFIPVHSRYSCWAELILIHILVPRSSFVGHLSGILVGLLYVYGPLKPLMDSIITPSPAANASGYGFFSGSGERRSRYRNWASSDPEPSSRYSAPQYAPDGQHTGRNDPYTGGMTEQEQMQHAMRESLRQDNLGSNPRPTGRSEPTAPPMEGEMPQSPPYPTHDPPTAPQGPPYPTHDPPTAPPGQAGIYPDLSGFNTNSSNPQNDARHRPATHDTEDVRQRRLRRFDSRS